MASILDLFKSQASPRAPSGSRTSPDDFIRGRRFQEDDPDYEDIVVTATPSVSGIRDVPVEEATPRAPMKSFEETFGPQFTTQEHKGRFGQKGLLRDILGTIGDAFLVQSGNKPIYGPKRQQERESDAMVGFSRNPLAAIERLAQENPEAAREMYEKYQTNALGLDRLDFDRKKFEDEGPDREALRAGRVANSQRVNLSNARTLIGSISSPAQWSAARPRLQQRLKDAGLGEWADLIPEEFDPDVNYLFMDPKDLAAMEDRDALRNQQMAIAKLRDRRQAAGQAITQSLGNRRAAVAERNATTAEKRLEKSGNSKSYDFGPPPADVGKKPPARPRIKW